MGVLFFLSFLLPVVKKAITLHLDEAIAIRGLEPGTRRGKSFAEGQASSGYCLIESFDYRQ